MGREPGCGAFVPLWLCARFPSAATREPASSVEESELLLLFRGFLVSRTKTQRHKGRQLRCLRLHPSSTLSRAGLLGPPSPSPPTLPMPCPDRFAIHRQRSLPATAFVGVDPFRERAGHSLKCLR